MATRGVKPKPASLKLITGNPGHRPIAQSDVIVRESPLEPPGKLLAAQRKLWERYIDTAWWLTDHDAPKAYMWVCLMAEFSKSPGDMTASRIANLRALGAEIGLDPSARTRMAIADRGNAEDPTEKFFD